MTLPPLSAPGPVVGATAPHASRFGQLLQGQPPEVGPTPVHATAPALRATPAAQAPGVRALDQLQAAQRRMDEVLRLAESGRHFSPAELLALQAHVYRASQQLDLAGKVVEKATGGVKQVLQTQV